MENRKKLRDKIVSRGRVEVRRKLKSGEYMNEKRKQYGIMNEAEFVADEEFLRDMIKEIERDRLRRMVYDKEYQRIDLDDWYKMRAKKDRNKRLKEKVEENRRKKAG